MKDVADYFNAKISINSSHKQQVIRCLICQSKLVENIFKRLFARTGIVVFAWPVMSLSVHCGLIIYQRKLRRENLDCKLFLKDLCYHGQTMDVAIHC